MGIAAHQDQGMIAALHRSRVGRIEVGGAGIQIQGPRIVVGPLGGLGVLNPLLGLSGSLLLADLLGIVGRSQRGQRIEALEGGLGRLLGGLGQLLNPFAFVICLFPSADAAEDFGG